MNKTSKTTAMLRYEAPECVAMDTQAEGVICQSFGLGEWSEGNKDWFNE